MTAAASGVGWVVQDLTARNALVVAQPEVGKLCKVLDGSGSLYTAVSSGTGAGAWSGAGDTSLASEVANDSGVAGTTVKDALNAVLTLAGGTMTGALVIKAVIAITASTTQTQGQGALTGDVNQISVCANANDTVTLPVPAAGKRCLVLNDGSNPLKVYPPTGCDLGAGANTSTTIAVGARTEFVGSSTTVWKRSVPAGTTVIPGLLAVTDATNSTSTTTAASPNSVKSAYDLATAAMPRTGGTATLDLSSIAAATAELKVTATSDTPSVTYAAHVASADPAGYIKILDGANVRFVPYFA